MVIQDGSFWISLFSGPNTATPHVCWPTLRYLQRQQTSDPVLTSVPDGPVLLPVRCLHQRLLGHGEESLSVLLLQLIRDSTQEAAHSCNTYTHTREGGCWCAFHLLVNFRPMKTGQAEIIAPLSAGATGASTAEKTDSLASSMSCWVNVPDFTQSTLSSKADKVCTELGSLSRETKSQKSLRCWTHPGKRAPTHPPV